MKDLISIMDEMKHNQVGNYVIAGLDSYMIGGDNKGCVRFFENSRNQQDAITPHSHRFNFTCLVVKGWVRNRIWSATTEEDSDFFEVSELYYGGEIGSHDKQFIERSFWKYSDKEFAQREVYSMKASEVHSIIFSKGAKVLFFEGPSVSEKSIILEPVVRGEVIPTFVKPEWMFQPIKSAQS